MIVKTFSPKITMEQQNAKSIKCVFEKNAGCN